MSAPKIDQLRQRITAAQTAATQVETTAAAAASSATEARDQATSTQPAPDGVSP